ncbi:hypothetical protein FN976_15240 [Caenimonas sedimenti]|uniref:Uncharacterized protein n=1 Tax=Caenimonas sedimenti TaxID=2596921 RepID=A0A562ZPP4_9BURK|nr:hypothetical protein [Caenimonas sedimenti]TWO70341.1 hypothetical protein FN976_15240 [Caenimonas sedimenti]
MLAEACAIAVSWTEVLIARFELNDALLKHQAGQGTLVQVLRKQERHAQAVRHVRERLDLTYPTPLSRP